VVKLSLAEPQFRDSCVQANFTLPDLVILSQDHFQSMCVYMVCACVCVHSNTLILEAVLFGKLPVEKQPTQHGEDGEKNKINRVHTLEKTMTPEQ